MCYHENTPTGCTKKHCEYKHENDEKVKTNNSTLLEDRTTNSKEYHEKEEHKHSDTIMPSKEQSNHANKVNKNILDKSDIKEDVVFINNAPMFTMYKNKKCIINDINFMWTQKYKTDLLKSKSTKSQYQNGEIIMQDSVPMFIFHRGKKCIINDINFIWDKDNKYQYDYSSSKNRKYMNNTSSGRIIFEDGVAKFIVINGKERDINEIINAHEEREYKELEYNQKGGDLNITFLGNDEIISVDGRPMYVARNGKKCILNDIRVKWNVKSTLSRIDPLSLFLKDEEQIKGNTKSMDNEVNSEKSDSQRCYNDLKQNDNGKMNDDKNKRYDRDEYQNRNVEYRTSEDYRKVNKDRGIEDRQQNREIQYTRDKSVEYENINDEFKTSEDYRKLNKDREGEYRQPSREIQYSRNEGCKFDDEQEYAFNKDMKRKEIYKNKGIRSNEFDEFNDFKDDYEKEDRFVDMRIRNESDNPNKKKQNTENKDYTNEMQRDTYKNKINMSDKRNINTKNNHSHDKNKDTDEVYQYEDAKDKIYNTKYHDNYVNKPNTNYEDEQTTNYDRGKSYLSSKEYSKYTKEQNDERNLRNKYDYNQECLYESETYLNEKEREKSYSKDDHNLHTDKEYKRKDNLIASDKREGLNNTGINDLEDEYSSMHKNKQNNADQISPSKHLGQGINRDKNKKAEVLESKQHDNHKTKSQCDSKEKKVKTDNVENKKKVDKRNHAKTESTINPKIEDIKLNKNKIKKSDQTISNTTTNIVKRKSSKCKNSGLEENDNPEMPKKRKKPDITSDNGNIEKNTNKQKTKNTNDMNVKTTSQDIDHSVNSDSEQKGEIKLENEVKKVFSISETQESPICSENEINLEEKTLSMKDENKTSHETEIKINPDESSNYNNVKKPDNKIEKIIIDAENQVNDNIEVNEVYDNKKLDYEINFIDKNIFKEDTIQNKDEINKQQSNKKVFDENIDIKINDNDFIKSYKVFLEDIKSQEQQVTFEDIKEKRVDLKQQVAYLMKYSRAKRNKIALKIPLSYIENLDMMKK